MPKSKSVKTKGREGKRCQEQERAKESDVTRQGCQEIFCSTRSWSSAHPFCGHFFLYTSQKNQSLNYTANLTGDIPFLESGVELPTCEVGGKYSSGFVILQTADRWVDTWKTMSKQMDMENPTIEVDHFPLGFLGVPPP